MEITYLGLSTHSSFSLSWKCHFSLYSWLGGRAGHRSCESSPSLDNVGHGRSIAELYSQQPRAAALGASSVVYGLVGALLYVYFSRPGILPNKFRYGRMVLLAMFVIIDFAASPTRLINREGVGGPKIGTSPNL